MAYEHYQNQNTIKMVSKGGDISALPEDCIANVLSFTSPRDTCSLSMVSSMFKNAAQFDTVWERFLPPDYHSIISRSSDPNNSVIATSSKKQMIVRLCKNPILIDYGKKSFWIEKSSGKKCFMLSVGDLTITWSATPYGTPEYWSWHSDPDSRFAKVAELIDACWVHLRGKISTDLLSTATVYNAYLVFKLDMMRTYGLDFPVEATVGGAGSEDVKRSVILDVIGNNQQNLKERGDGWLEVELGEFLDNGENGELEITVMGEWKSGLIVNGTEILPKEPNKSQKNLIN